MSDARQPHDFNDYQFLINMCLQRLWKQSFSNLMTQYDLSWYTIISYNVLFISIIQILLCSITVSCSVIYYLYRLLNRRALPSSQHRKYTHQVYYTFHWHIHVFERTLNNHLPPIPICKGTFLDDHNIPKTKKSMQKIIRHI